MTEREKQILTILIQCMNGLMTEQDCFNRCVGVFTQQELVDVCREARVFRMLQTQCQQPNRAKR